LNYLVGGVVFRDGRRENEKEFFQLKVLVAGGQFEVFDQRIVTFDC
jgi:hypothetical protein